MDDDRFSILDSRLPKRIQEAGPINCKRQVDSISPAGVRPRIGSRRLAGFTLIEVLVAILIVAVVAMVLLYRRIDVVRDAARIRDQRVAWTLIAFKLGDLSRDPSMIRDSDSGDFAEDAPDLAEFRWSYEAQSEAIPLDDEPGQTVRAVRRVKLKILDPEDVELQTIEAMFPETATEETE